MATHTTGRGSRHSDPAKQVVLIPILVSFRVFSANIPALRPVCDLISVGPERKA